MLTSNDSAKVLARIASDLIKREKHDIVANMDPQSKVEFYNSVITLNEITDEIAKDVVNHGDLFFLDTGS